MKHQNFKVDLSGWNIGVETINNCIIRKIENILQVALESNETYAYFPIGWEFAGGDGIGGGVVDDAATMYIRFGLESDGGIPTFRFSLRDVVSEFLDGIACSEGEIADDHKKAASLLRDVFIELAEQINGSLE